MTTIKLGTHNSPSASSAATNEDDDSVVATNDQHRTDPFTGLDRDMIELENFINQCPLPTE